MLRIAVVATLCFLPAVVAKKPLYCSEPKDKHGLTCSQYLKSGVGSSCLEMFTKFGFIAKNNLHCQCACPEYYEPVGEDQKTCEAWQNNKKCPEAFSERSWDYHPNGDGSLENCMSICSNIGEPSCCYFSETNKCWSHGLTMSMKLRKNLKGSKATLCNLPCKKKFYVTLKSKSGKGWGAGELTIHVLISQKQLSFPVTMTTKDSFEKKVTVCARETSFCYSAELTKGRGGDEEMSFEIKDSTGKISVSHTGPGSYTFGSGNGCPGRELKRMGRYALSQVNRMKLNEINGKKMLRNILRRSESLGIQVLPLEKVGSIFSQNQTGYETKKKNNNKNKEESSDYCDPPKNTPNQKCKQVTTISSPSRDDCEAKAKTQKAPYFAFAASSKLCQVSQTCEKISSKVDWVVYQLCVMPETTKAPVTGPIVTDMKFMSTECSAADMCDIDNAKDCEKAATEMRLSDTTPTSISVAKALAGCYLDGKSLIFNSKLSHTKGKKKPSDSNKVICKPCPYVSPYCKRVNEKAKCKNVESKAGFKSELDCELEAVKAKKRFYAFTSTNGGMCQMTDKCTSTKTSVDWQIKEICAPAPAPKPTFPAPSPVEAAVILDADAQKKNAWATHCNHEDHCVIKTAQRCQQVANKLNLTKTVQVISKFDVVGGCYQEDGQTLFNKALASNRNLAVKGKQFVICEECKWRNPAPKAPAPAPKTRQTLPPTTTPDGKRGTDAPIALASTKKSCKADLGCRIEDLGDCTTAGESMKLGKATSVGTKARKNNPAGCFFNGNKLMFNPKFDSGVSVDPAAGEYLVCDNCGHVPAPAPRVKTTTKATRAPETSQTRPEQKAPAPSKRVETTKAIRGPKPFQILETCSTKENSCLKCSDADLCVIESKEECEQAAKFLALEDQTVQTITQKTSLAGCRVNSGKSLIFNTRVNNNSPVGTGNRNVCALCPTTTPPPRTTVKIVRTEPPTTTVPQRTGDSDDNVQSERTSSSSRGGTHFFKKLGEGTCADADKNPVAYCTFALNDCSAKCNSDSGCFGYANKKISKGRECRTYTSTTKEDCIKQGAISHSTGAQSRKIGTAVANKNYEDCIVKCGTQFSYFAVCGDSFGGLTTTVKGQWKAPVALLLTNGEATCRAAGCTIESSDECEKAAKELKLTYEKYEQVEQKKQPFGCRLDTEGSSKILTFNSKGRTIKNTKDSGSGLVCAVCAPAPAPKREETTTKAPTRGSTTIATSRVEKTEAVRTTTTAPPRTENSRGGDRDGERDGETTAARDGSERDATTTAARDAATTAARDGSERDATTTAAREAATTAAREAATTTAAREAATTTAARDGGSSYGSSRDATTTAARDGGSDRDATTTAARDGGSSYGSSRDATTTAARDGGSERDATTAERDGSSSERDGSSSERDATTAGRDGSSERSVDTTTAGRSDGGGDDGRSDGGATTINRSDGGGDDGRSG